MKILILSRKRSLYSTKRFREEGSALGHEIDIADPLKCVLRLSHGQPSMLVAFYLAMCLRRGLKCCGSQSRAPPGWWRIEMCGDCSAEAVED